MPCMLPARARLGLLVALGLWPLGHGPASAAEVRERILGDPAAPVTIIEYASLTCPHCAAFHRETLPVLKERYIDTGKARLVFRDFPLDRAALAAAALAHCAGDARYFKFLDAMFANQQSWARASDPVAALRQLTRLGGLSDAEAEACLADQGLQDAILQTRLDGEREFGVNSTPTILVNGEKAADSSVEAIAALIDPLVN